MKIEIGEKRIIDNNACVEGYPLCYWGQEIGAYYPQWNHSVIVKMNRIKLVDDIVKAIYQKFGNIAASGVYNHISFV